MQSETEAYFAMEVSPRCRYAIHTIRCIEYGDLPPLGEAEKYQA